MTILRKLSFLIFISLLVFSSCKKDQIIEEEVIITSVPTVIVDGSLTGIVVDKNGLALENTEVRVGTHNILTDENGVFTFKNIKLDKAGSLVTAEKNGYFNSAKFVRANLNKLSFIKIMLIEKTLTGSFDAATGGSIVMNGDASVEIPASSIKLEGGSTYTGNVNVYATWLDPTSENLLLEMPGDLRGTNTDDQQVQLVTYGMIGVELEGDAGEVLNIADGKTATIELPVPAELQSSAPATIPLWHFDEATGYWIEDGTATLQNGKYVGTVSHFSFWNCDDPNFFIDLTGTITGEGSNGLEGLLVKIELTGTGASGYGYTNEEGVFNGFVPKDEVLTLSVLDECGAVIYSAEIGPFSEDTELDPFAVGTTSNFITFSGTLNCNGDAVSNGYVKVDFGESFKVLQVDPDGAFNSTISVCSAIEVTVTGYDLNALKQSEPATYDIAGLSELNLESINVCEEDLTEIFILDIDGTVFTFLDPSVDEPAGSNNLFINVNEGNADSTFVALSVMAIETGVAYNPEWFEASISDMNNPNNWYAVGCQGCPDLDVEFTSLETDIGGLVEGAFSGEAMNWTTGGGAVPVSGSFRIIRD